MSIAEIDEAKLESFMGQAVTDMGAIFSAPLFVIGEELGLYRSTEFKTGSRAVPS